MENISKVHLLLGGSTIVGDPPRSEFDFVGIIRKGLSARAISALRDNAKLNDETMCRLLGIAKRTMQRRKQQGRRLKPRESEVLLRLARVLTFASHTLGSLEKAREWLLHENRTLRGSVPIDLLDTDLGFREVMRVLKRIDHGVYS